MYGLMKEARRESVLYSPQRMMTHRSGDIDWWSAEKGARLATGNRDGQDMNLTSFFAPQFSKRGGLP